MLFHHFPKELIDYILSWEGSMKLRNGKWMGPLRTSEETLQRINSSISNKYKFYNRESKKIVHWFIQIPCSTHKKIFNAFIYIDGDVRMSLSEYDQDWNRIGYHKYHYM